MNTVIFKGEDLKKCLLQNLEYDEKLGGGSLVLAGPLEGTITSDIIYPEGGLNDIVASWNTQTPKGTCVEVLGRLMVEGRWSKWLTWGTWSTLIPRECPDDEDSVAYSNSYRDGGDSSLNPKGGKIAEAFQIKAVLRASACAEEMPSLQLLAASWKNTAAENWEDKLSYPEEKGEIKDRVLLSTPAISQVRRDPNYGGVICSATSMTMMMGGLGLPLLPEEVTFANMDYGFGGNGNWSFTCAAAGAYGFESYACYTDFEGVRAELSKGNAIAFSVKYSNRKDSDVPYMENTTITTHGHLVVGTGYYYDEERGEYGYYINDPAGGYDLSVGPRVYFEKDLSKAWKRRLIYICRKKESEGLGKHAFKHVAARFEPCPCRKGVYKLMDGDRFIALSTEFLRDKRQKFGGHGTIYWYVEGDERELADGVTRVEANHVFHYEGIMITDDGAILNESDMWGLLKSKGKNVVVGVIDNSGVHYKIKL